MELWFFIEIYIQYNANAKVNEYKNSDTIYPYEANINGSLFPFTNAHVHYGTNITEQPEEFTMAFERYNNHVIGNLNVADTNGIGFFDTLEKRWIIKDLGLVNGSIPSTSDEETIWSFSGNIGNHFAIGIINGTNGITTNKGSTGGVRSISNWYANAKVGESQSVFNK